MGAVAERLSRLGIKPVAVAVAGMAAFMITQVLLILEVTTWASTVSPSQSTLNSRSSCTLPDCSPLRQSDWRERE